MAVKNPSIIGFGQTIGYKGSKLKNGGLQFLSMEFLVSFSIMSFNRLDLFFFSFIDEGSFFVQ